MTSQSRMDKRKAIELMCYYMGMAVDLSEDNRVELSEMVECIIDAAVSEAVDAMENKQ